MISLAQYIEEYYNSELYQHLEIEFNLMTLNEGFGFSKEVHRVSKKIIEQIEKNIEKSSIKISDINCSFFKTIEITLINKNVDKSEGESYIKKCSKENVYFGIIFNKKHYDYLELLSTIEHEVLHIYQNYNLLNKSTTLIKRLDKDNYRSYNDFKNVSSSLDIMKLVLYYTNKYEISAFIQQDLAILKKENPQNAKATYEIIKKTEYYNLLKMLNEFKENFSEYLEDFDELYKQIVTNDRNLTKEQIKKKLKKRIDEAWKYYIVKISKSCTEFSEFKFPNNVNEMKSKLLEWSKFNNKI